MQQYLEVLQDVLHKGKDKSDPQGIGNIAVCGREMRFWVDENCFPIITTKFVSFRNIVGELLWILRGESNVKWLQDRKIRIWDEWATPEACAQYGLPAGSLGMIYGPLWRTWPTTDGKTIDQIEDVVRTLKINPDSRRLIVSSWHPEFTDKVYVAPCHCFFKFFHAQGELSLHLFQRSADLFLGVPYNISSYSLLLLMMAKVTGLKPAEFVHTMSDVHLYKNSIEAVKIQLKRKSLPLPKIEIPDISDLSLATIKQLEPEDFKLVDYKYHSKIQVEVGV
ncbi:MAG: thymidylate synthase [bacterium]|nr:thymidylate synthase [bacterium]